MTKPDTPRQSPVERRLDRLVRLASAAAFWEGLWRGLIPPLVVIGLFLCVSWLGLWLDVSHLGRMIGVAVFAVLLASSTFGLWTLAPLSRREALGRIDRASGLTHRPASVLDDTLATAGRDPSTDALWALHRRRAEAESAKLRPGRPSPRAVELDRYALRAGIVVALVACAIVAGPQRYARVAAAFDFGEGQATGTSTRLDAWIDPPPYTGQPPVLLDLAAADARDSDHPRVVSAPAGSVVIIRSSGGVPAEIETTGPLLPPPAKPVEPAKTDAAKADPASADAANGPAESVPGDSERRLVLHGDSRLVLRQGGALRGNFDLTAIADRPPTIMLREVPKSNARGSLTLAYTTGDDYGVSKAEVLFSDPMIDGTPIQGPSLVPAPKGELSLPGVSGGIGDAETTLDLSDSPWAGTQVRMVLVAHDEGGNEGRSEPVTITLPEKPFSNPVARALVEQRRNLVLNPRQRNDVATALDAMMIAPEAFGTNASVYLGLRFASTSLANAQTDAQLVAVADFLWDMAQQIENGDLTDAEKALRNAEKALHDALDRHASDQEIKKLTQNLRTAMDKYLKELAEQQRKQDQQAKNDQQGRPSKSISQKDLQAMIDKLEQQARSGDTEAAKKALEELQNLLENAKAAKKQKADPQSRAMAEGLNQLDQAMRDQQDLRDETYKKGQQGQQQGQQNQGQQNQDEDAQMPGGQDPGQSEGMNSGPGPQGQRQGRKAEGQESDGQSGEGQEGGQGKTGRGQGEGLSQRQQELRDRLGQIQKKLKQAGEGQGDLDEAGKAMREAEDALKQGQGGNTDAVDQQGKALDAMRRGAKKLSDAMSQQGDPGGQANGENDGSTGSKEGQQSENDDPLGRPRGGNNTLNSMSRFDPMGIPAAQRAQRVLEELRRRLGDPNRAQEEIDYLERLLRSY